MSADLEEELRGMLGDSSESDDDKPLSQIQRNCEDANYWAKGTHSTNNSVTVSLNIGE